MPITNGLAIGEFAQMLNGEGWLPIKPSANCALLNAEKYLLYP
ncbi:hypothetical protein [Paraflavitalea speifideaquila]|nr:hypothetical protein [Paraflavitalea speifideiaquila]